MVPIPLKGWRTGMDRTTTGSTLPSSPIPMPKKYLPMPRPWGTIALAVYKEKIAQITPRSDMSLPKREAPAAQPLGLQARVVPPANINWKRGNKLALDLEKQRILLPMWSNLTLNIPLRKKSFSNTSGDQYFAEKELSHAVRKTDSGPMIWNSPRSPRILTDD